VGLGPADFEVISDGQVRPVASFSADDEPVALILLVDVSASNPIPLDILRRAAERSLGQGRKPPDRVRVGGLARALTLSPRFATDPGELRRAARAVLAPRDADRFGPSPLWDGVETAVETLEPEPGRRGIVLVTDGRATGNVRSLAYAASHAIAADVPINIVAVPAEMILPQTPTTAARVRPATLLEEMARATGGACLLIRQLEDVEVLLVRSLGQLHQTCTIGFPPAAWDGRAHALEVRVKRPGVKVRAKSAYMADVPRGAADSPGRTQR
jgi:Ca-activated chloride channel family protein